MRWKLNEEINATWSLPVWHRKINCLTFFHFFPVVNSAANAIKNDKMNDGLKIIFFVMTPFQRSSQGPQSPPYRERSTTVKKRMSSMSARIISFSVLLLILDVCYVCNLSLYLHWKQQQCNLKCWNDIDGEFGREFCWI